MAEKPLLRTITNDDIPGTTGPIDPSNPTDPSNPIDPIDPTDPPKSTDPDKENPGEGTDNPQTGDSSHPFVWIMLAFFSGGAVLTLTLRGKGKTNQ